MKESTRFLLSFSFLFLFLPKLQNGILFLYPVCLLPTKNPDGEMGRNKPNQILWSNSNNSNQIRNNNNNPHREELKFPSSNSSKSSYSGENQTQPKLTISYCSFDSWRKPNLSGQAHFFLSLLCIFRQQWDKNSQKRFLMIGNSNNYLYQIE